MPRLVCDTRRYQIISICLLDLVFTSPQIWSYRDSEARKRSKKGERIGGGQRQLKTIKIKSSCSWSDL